MYEDYRDAHEQKRRDAAEGAPGAVLLRLNGHDVGTRKGHATPALIDEVPRHAVGADDHLRECRRGSIAKAQACSVNGRRLVRPRGRGGYGVPSATGASVQQ